ncbi:MAG: hypothetical protein HOV81_40285 [Kofleriaceae bacterium]|nr:hypothetical protein [Kofleriaceae bacterium]
MAPQKPVATSGTKPSAAVPSSGRPEIAFHGDSADGALTATLASAQLVSTGATITDLSTAETEALLARLEPLPDVSKAPAPPLRPPSAAPPRSGTITPIAFVRPTGKAVSEQPISPAPAIGVPLAAPQILPVGEVAAESEIRVRFDEPMVAVAAVGKQAPPVATITPSVPGSWRWVDTRVAQFTASGPRLPQATEFAVTVAAGIKAVTGAKLADDATQKFATPPVMLKTLYPTVVLRPDSPIVVGFDQEIDPATITKFLRVEDEKRHKLPFKTITLDAAKPLWAKNPSVKYDAATLPKYHVILAPTTAWRPGMAGRVVLAKGAPSQEGPRVATEETAASFDIADHFVARGISCDDGERVRLDGSRCSAWGYMQVQFSNPIDVDRYHAKYVQIEGERVEDHVPSYQSVGLTTPRVVGKSFAVSIDGRITDAYGQAYEGQSKLTFSTVKMRHEPYVFARAGLYVLDPRFAIPQWIVHAQALSSLHIELYQVQPSDYFAFEDFEAGKRKTPPGKRVYDKTHPVGARWAANARVDLRPALAASGTGHVIAIATGIAANGSKVEAKRVAWIQVSKLGVTARIDGERINAWAQDVTPAAFLKPIEGATTSLLVEGRSDAPAPVTTDADGHAAYELLPAPVKAEPYRTALLVAKKGDDATFTSIGGRWAKSQRLDQARWYVTDDRFTYKPGETVYVKGWIRWTNNGVDPDLALPASGDKIAYSLVDSRGNKLASGDAEVTGQGGFDLQVALPANANLGTATFSLVSKGQSIRHPISIEEFRTPAYAVDLNDDVTHGGATPLLLGETIEMNAEAKYYAGGGLAGARIVWDASLASATYRPPGWDRYTFTPIANRAAPQWGSTSASEESSLSGASASGIVFGVSALPYGKPSVLTVDATVTDIDRQTIRASSRKIVVHPASLYVGIRQKPDSWETLQFVVTDIDGNVVAGVPVDVSIEGVLGSEMYRDDAEVIDTQSCKLTSAATPVTCNFTRKDLQTAYSATARIADPRGRTNTAQYWIPWWTYADRDFAVVPDKKSYKPGDVAKLEIRSEIVPATAVVSFARQGVIAQKRIQLTGKTTKVELPITEAYIQNVNVVVDRIAKRRYQNGNDKDPLPEVMSTELSLPVDIDSARLDMRARSTQPLVEPGENATFEVEVRRDDKPVAGAEVALIVVDEAILALSGKSHADPLQPFYRDVGHGTQSVQTLAMIEDAGYELNDVPGYRRWNLDDPSTGVGAGGGGSGYGTIGTGRYGTIGHGSGSGTAIVKARKDFRATAVFSPTLTTDASGKAIVTVKMPDSLTRFRIVALATSNTRTFGKAESNIVTQRKLNARTVAPRFLTQGDAFSLPVVVQNLDRTARTIDVAVRAANLAGTGPAGKRVVVPGGQRAELRFDFATQARGKVVIQTIATSGKFADASNVELQVYEPATTESFATYGSLDDKPQFERLEVPKDVFADVGGVETELASTQLQNLNDAYWYLYAYPFECAEQRSSRMLATSAMYDILDAFATPGRPTRQEILDMQAYDVKKLTRDQLADGSWGYFRGMAGDPYVTMQVLTALAAQKEPGAAMQKATAYVIKRAASLQADLDAKVKSRDIKQLGRDIYSVSLAASALSAIASTGIDVSGRAVRLHEAATALGSYPVDAKARVLAILAGKPKHAAIRGKLLADLLGAIHETAAAATVTAQFTESERLLLVSSNKTSALVLDALLRETPKHALIPKLARGLLDARKGGRWMSTQENLTVLSAMRRYFDVIEKDTPNYTGKLWLGSSAYTEASFVGRSNVRATANLDWSTLAPGTAHDITLAKTGPGRMYYRIGITYAPKQADLPPLDAGFIVRRSYKAVDDPDDVVELPGGRWKIKLGARVLVRLEALNTSQRHAVALVDPLPAGLEPVNTNLATSERAAVDHLADTWDHTNMRDNRSEAFAMDLAPGTHLFSYTARATTPGRFLAAPAKAEEMYSPETFGRSAGTTVVVE